MNTLQKTCKVPWPIQLSIVCIFFGAFYPIYGITIPAIGKLTGYRIGLIGLLFLTSVYSQQISYCIRRRIFLFVLLLIILRGLSLFLSTGIGFSVGIRMLEWFIESSMASFLVACTILKFPLLLRLILKLITYLGGAGILIFAVQTIQFNMTGTVTALPFSMGRLGVYGLNETADFFLYPIGPGWRIIGAFLESNVAGSFIIMMSVFGLALFAHNKMSLKKYLGLLIFFLSLIALWGNGSRQSLVFIFLGVLVLLMTEIHYQQQIGRFLKITFVIFVGLLILSSALQVYYDSHSILEKSGHGSLGYRISSMISNDEVSTLGHRSERYFDLFHYLGVKTLFLGEGEGFGHNSPQTGGVRLVSCHNGYLIVLLENGGLACLLLLSFCYVLLTNIWSLPAQLFPGYQNEILLFRSVLPSWVVLWCAYIFLNWTQLNMNLCWAFVSIAIACILKKQMLLSARSSSTRQHNLG